MMHWVAWAILLVTQNAAFTWVSRARNSNNIPHHAVASVASNLVYAINFYLLTNVLAESHTIMTRAVAIVAYTGFTAMGSVWVHWLMVRNK